MLVYIYNKEVIYYSMYRDIIVYIFLLLTFEVVSVSSLICRRYHRVLEEALT